MDTKKLRQKILDLAIHGKLVPQDPNDEPASVLLERIRAEKERLIKEGKIKRSKKSASDTPHYENEVLFEVPESWECCHVSDIFELNPKNNVPDDTQSGFIPMACVDDGFGYAHSFETRPWGEIRKGYSHFQNGDIGIAKISPCFENRKSTIFYDLPNGIGAGTTELTVLRGHCVNIEFYLYLFQSEWYIFEGTKEFKGVVGQQRVNKEIFTTLLIPLPPIEEQNRIVTEIKKWFSLIDTLETAKEDLQESIAQAKSKILDLAIHGKLVPQDPSDEPAIELLKRINPKFTPCDNAHYENIPFEIPKSWEWTCMAEVNEYNSASVDPSKSPDKDFELYSVPAYETGMPEFVKGKDISSSKKSVSRNDVLLCKINPHLNRAWIVSHYKEDIPCLASSEWIIFRNSSIIPQYLSFCFTSNYFKELMLNNVSGVGGSLMRAQPAIVYKYLFPLPPINEQRRIVSAIQEYYEILDGISANL